MDLDNIKQRNRQMLDFCAELSSLAEALKENDHVVSDANLRSLLLQGVHSKYAQTVEILALSPDLKFADAQKARHSTINKIHRKEDDEEEVSEDADAEDLEEGRKAMVAIRCKNKPGSKTSNKNDWKSLCRNFGEGGHDNEHCERRYCSDCRSGTHKYIQCRACPTGNAQINLAVLDAGSLAL